MNSRFSPEPPGSPPYPSDHNSARPDSPPSTIDLSKPLDIGRTKMGEQPPPPVYDPSKPLTIASNRPKPK